MGATPLGTNDRGLIVGYSFTNLVCVFHAVLWTNTPHISNKGLDGDPAAPSAWQWSGQAVLSATGTSVHRFCSFILGISSKIRANQ